MDGSDDRDPLEGLEDRLQSHAKAFESLLALTPAQDYYGSQIVDGKDPSEQWNRKKQTKEQKRAAKKAKLDPANQKSALDVMKEREAEAMKRKRKREEDNGEGEGGESGEEGAAEPVQAPKRKRGEEDADAAEARRRLKAEKRKEKRQEKKAKVEKKKEKSEAKKAAKQDRDLEDAQTEKRKSAKELEAADEEDDDEDEPDLAEKDADLEDVDFSGLADQREDEVEDVDDAASEGSSAPSTPAVDSPAFDVSTNHSTASSSSSIIPPEVEEESSKAPPQTKQARPQKPTVDTKSAAAPSARQETSKSTDPPSGVSSPKIQLPDIDHEELQARVRKRIEELRAARKADGPEGKPVKSRQDLLEQRRKKGEQKKAAKKAQRQKQKEDEAQRQEAQLRGSGSPLSADIFSPRSPKPQENNYSFSRLAFDDGTSADPTLTSLRDPKKTKGPSDPRTALQAAQKKEARIAGYDPAKRAEIGEKDMWLHARQRAQGERVRDDTSLLKKALKRKEKQKGKSGEQWREREQAVVEGKVKKQKKREANLQKRKDDKGGKGKKGKSGKGGKSPGGGKKKGGRPGFEGRFKA